MTFAYHVKSSHASPSKLAQNSQPPPSPTCYRILLANLPTCQVLMENMHSVEKVLGVDTFVLKGDNKVHYT